MNGKKVNLKSKPKKSSLSRGMSKLYVNWNTVTDLEIDVGRGVVQSEAMVDNYLLNKLKLRE